MLRFYESSSRKYYLFQHYFGSSDYSGKFDVVANMSMQGIFFFLTSFYSKSFNTSSLMSVENNRLGWSLTFAAFLLIVIVVLNDKSFPSFDIYHYGTNWRLYDVISRSSWFLYCLLVVLMLPSYRNILSFRRTREKHFVHSVECFLPKYRRCSDRSPVERKRNRCRIDN